MRTMSTTSIPDDQKTCLVVALPGRDLRRLDLMLPPGQTRDDFILDIIRRGAPPDRSTRKTLHYMEKRLRALEGSHEQLFAMAMRQAGDIGTLEGGTADLPHIRKRLDTVETLASDARTAVARGASMLVIVVLIACVVGVAIRAFSGL